MYIHMYAPKQNEERKPKTDRHTGIHAYIYTCKHVHVHTQTQAGRETKRERDKV